MVTRWKAVADDNRRQMLLLLKDEEKTPTQMASNFDFTLPALSTHLRVLWGRGFRKRAQGWAEQTLFCKQREDVGDDGIPRHVLGREPDPPEGTREEQGGGEGKVTEGEIRKTIIVDAPPKVVFRALTDERELVQWMPQEARMEARVGGEYEFKYHWAQRGLDAVATGKILELIPYRRLSYTFVSSRSGSGTSLTSSTVTWMLDDLLDGKTRGSRWSIPASRRKSTEIPMRAGGTIRVSLHATAGRWQELASDP